MKYYIGIGIMFMCICLGMGGCVYLCNISEAARIQAERSSSSPTVPTK